MKNLFVVICLLYAGFQLSAQESDSCTYDALIIGKDVTKCMCCGGWQVKVGEKVYLIWDIPQLGLKHEDRWISEVPIPVKIDFGILEHGCDNRIIILCLEKKQNTNQ